MLESNDHRLKWGKSHECLVSPTMQLGRGSFQKEDTVVLTRKQVKCVLGSQISRGPRHNPNVVVNHQETETNSDR